MKMNRLITKLIPITPGNPKAMSKSKPKSMQVNETEATDSLNSLPPKL